MPSPFAKYQSEQVQQLAPGFVEAYGNAGRSIGQGIAGAADSIGKGMIVAEEKRKNEIKTRAALAPYIRNDDRIIATEGMIKSGLLTKADDGTVVVSAKYDQYADKKGLAKYLDFYNQTGGDGSKLSGDALIDFAGKFEGEQKFIAEKAANENAKIDRQLKQAQIAKANAEAAAKAAETGLVADIMRGIDGEPEAPSSPTAGIDLSRFMLGGGDKITPPTPSVTKVAETVPGVAAPATAPAEPAAVSLALTAGTKAAASKDEVATMAKNLGMTKSGLIQNATRYGQTPQEYAANLQSILDARGEGKAAPAKPVEDDIDAMASEAGMSKEQLLEASRISGVTPQEHISNLRAVAKAAAPTASPAAAQADESAVSPALMTGTTGTPAAVAPNAAEAPAAAEQAPTQAGQAQLEQRATAAGTPIPETYDVAAESVAVKERLDKVNADREAVRTKYTSERTKNAMTLARQRRQALALGVIAPQKGSAITSYLENSVKFQNEAEARELKALDEKESAINRDFANYQAAAGAKDKAKTTARLERKETAEAEAASQKLKQVLSDRKKKQLQEYPTYGVWTHLGARLGKNKETGEDLDPSDFGIAALTDQQRTSVNEAVEGWNKSTSFLLDLDTTLKTRIKQGGEWRQAFRLTATNMKNYYEAELASVFGVATLRRAIVSGGNFSDADREFVKSAITYLNTAAPDVSPEDLQASLNALSVFVNGLYERTLETNQMGFNPESAKAQADKLEKFGLNSQAGLIRKGVDRAELFYRRFGIKPPGGNEPSVSQGELKKAFDLLYPKMRAKGLLPDGMKAN